MNITFITPTNTLNNFGLRTITSYIDSSGHNVKIVHLKNPHIDNSIDYTSEVYDDLSNIISESDIVGISFVSRYFGQACFLTDFIKEKYHIPVIWGGVHATCSPDESIEHADMICVGEGEEALLTLLNKMEAGLDYLDIPNFWFKENSEVIKNPVANLIHDLDKYPHPLYDFEKEYILHEGRIVQLNEEIFKQYAEIQGEHFQNDSHKYYSLITQIGRGCPYSCTYCCNNLFKTLYKGKGKLLRTRSNETVIKELEISLKKFPFVNMILFFDDDLVYLDLDRLTEFASLYKERIGLPFRCCVNPANVTKEKIDILVRAGLIWVEMGLQSGSDRVNKDIYKRRIKNEEFLKASYIINEFPELMPVHDIILDNPMETSEDIKDSFRFFSKLPYPYGLSAFSLTFFPGTELYKYAIENNIIENERKEIYDKKNNVIDNYKFPYTKFLLFFLRAAQKLNYRPKYLWYLLTSLSVIKILNSKLLFPFWRVILASKKMFGDLKRRLEGSKKATE